LAQAISEYPTSPILIVFISGNGNCTASLTLLSVCSMMFTEYSHRPEDMITKINTTNRKNFILINFSPYMTIPGSGVLSLTTNKIIIYTQ